MRQVKLTIAMLTGIFCAVSPIYAADFFLGKIERDVAHVGGEANAIYFEEQNTHYKLALNNCQNCQETKDLLNSTSDQNIYAIIEGNAVEPTHTSSIGIKSIKVEQLHLINTINTPASIVLIGTISVADYSIDGRPRIIMTTARGEEYEVIGKNRHFFKLTRHLQRSGGMIKISGREVKFDSLAMGQKAIFIEKVLGQFDIEF